MRRPFAGTGETVLIDQTGVNAGATVTVWSSSVGGTQYTDLQATDGTPIAGGVLTSDNDGSIGEFLGPDDNTDEMYFEAGAGRFLVHANDSLARVRALEQTVGDLAVTVQSLQQGGGGGGGGIPDGSVLDGGTV